ncbi:MAG: GGDEF domain-containing protein [Rhodospirillum sp.]|nr:GGDEF domain-containing protein [Rhodospirillum sp.]MCF8489607.1 GGDEF domain-containing protein [Rhodospirillum sp.]MCF8499638.1 GGDEF domain-containing protein [Rhodospirillum sp.]
MGELMEHLHLPTLLFVFALLEVLKLGCFTVLWLPNRKEPGLEGWWLGYVIIDIGLFFIYGREALSIPFSLAILSGNICLIVGFYATLLGTWDFMERSRPRGWHHLPAFLGLCCAMALLVYFTVIAPSFHARVILIGAVVSGATLLQIIALWPMWRDRFHPMGKFLVVCLGLTLAVHIGRVIQPFFSETPLPGTILENNAHNVRVLIAAIIHAWLLAFGYMGVTVEKLVKRLRLQADRDPLTGLSNRRAFLEDAASLQVRDQTTSFSILAIDPDHLSRINDSLGMTAGDRALRHVANLLSTITRKGDSLAHVGGGEFALALPGADRVEALALAEIARALVEQYPAPIRSGSVVITISIGIATWTPVEPGHSPPPADALLQKAEEALSKAKERGRNQLSHNDFFTKAPPRP